jgi:hypothetical protein
MTERKNLNVSGLPTPSPAEFIFYFNKAKTRAEAVKLMQEAGFYMCSQNLYSRERNYRKAGLGIKDMPTRDRRLPSPDECARQLAAMQATEVMDQSDNE